MEECVWLNCIKLSAIAKIPFDQQVIVDTSYKRQCGQAGNFIYTKTSISNTSLTRYILLIGLETTPSHAYWCAYD